MFFLWEFSRCGKMSPAEICDRLAINYWKKPAVDK